jgi:hypothetical protein
MILTYHEVEAENCEVCQYILQYWCNHLPTPPVGYFLSHFDYQLAIRCCCRCREFFEDRMQQIWAGVITYEESM